MINSAASRDLPTPGSPIRVTSRQPHSHGSVEHGLRQQKLAPAADKRRSRRRGTGPRSAPRAAGKPRTAPTFPRLERRTSSTLTPPRTSLKVDSPNSASPGTRHLLQPRGHIDRVTGRICLAAPDDLTAVHPDPNLDRRSEALLEVRVRLDQPRLHLERGPAGTQGIILWPPAPRTLPQRRRR